MSKSIHVAALALLSLVSATARAQEQEGEIVITATRAPAAAWRVPARVETVERGDIEAQSLVSLAEALGGEAVQAGGFGQQASLFLRGANSRHTLALFDGVILNDAAAPNGQYDFGQDTLGALERIEILRGPASAVYGSGAIGGVVNLIPRRGGEGALEPFLEMSAGSLESERLLVGAAGTTGGLEYGISGEWTQTEGHDLVPARMATHTGDRDGASAAIFTANARREAGAVAFDLLLRHRSSEAEYDTFSGGPFFDLRGDDPDLGNKAQQSLWRAGAEWRPDGSLTLRVSGGQVLSERTERDGGVETNAADAARNFVDVAAMFARGPAAFNAGAAFERESIDTTPQFAAPLSAHEDRFGVYVVGQYALNEHITATAAARADSYEGFDTEMTYTLGLVGAFAPVRLYASYGTGFQAPSLSERYETSSFNLGNPNLRPEASRSWEVGGDFSLMEGFSLGAAYYQTRISNLIEYDFFELRNVNIGRAEINGAEGFLEARPTAWLSFRFAYAWTDARNGVTQAQLARRPEHSWRLTAAVWPSRRVALNATWAFIGDRSDVAYDDGGAFESGAGVAEGYDLGALSAQYALTNAAELFARVDNIADAVYEQPAAFAGAPRRALIGLRARF